MRRAHCKQSSCSNAKVRFSLHHHPMKLLLPLLLALCAISAQAQNDESNHIGQYYWKHQIVMDECNLAGTTNGNQVVSLAGQKFRVIATVDDGAIIRILDYPLPPVAAKDSGSFVSTANFETYNFSGTQTDLATLSLNAITSRNYGDFQRYFKVGFSELEANAQVFAKVTGSLEAGVLNYPFKFRPQSGKSDFTGAFNFGAAVGYQFPSRTDRNTRWSVLSAYGISNVVLDSLSVRQNSAQLANVNNFTAFTFSLGAMVEYEKVQVGVFVGWDNLSRTNHTNYEWIYQGKPWLSFGFGYSIFSTDKTSDSGDGTN